MKPRISGTPLCSTLFLGPLARDKLRLRSGTFNGVTSFFLENEVHSHHVFLITMCESNSYSPMLWFGNRILENLSITWDKLSYFIKNEEAMATTFFAKKNFCHQWIWKWNVNTSVYLFKELLTADHWQNWFFYSNENKRLLY